VQRGEVGLWLYLPVYSSLTVSNHLWSSLTVSDAPLMHLWLSLYFFLLFFFLSYLYIPKYISDVSMCVPMYISSVSLLCLCMSSIALLLQDNKTTNGLADVSLYSQCQKPTVSRALPSGVQDINRQPYESNRHSLQLRLRLSAAHVPSLKPCRCTLKRGCCSLYHRGTSATPA